GSAVAFTDGCQGSAVVSIDGHLQGVNDRSKVWLGACVSRGSGIYFVCVLRD
ncbi:hypothetical protein TorRG33x02_259630, partial [Trema orientale]